MREIFSLYRQLTFNFRIYFLAGIFWSLGLMIYFLVYNLYLLDLGFSASFIGQVAGAMSIGTLSIAIPSGWLLDYLGLTHSMRAGMLMTAAFLGLRATVNDPPSLLLFAFMSGITIGLWIVALPPFLTSNSHPNTRSWIFSLTYGSSIGTGIIAGLVIAAVTQLLGGQIGSSLIAMVQIKLFLLFSSITLILIAFSFTLLIRPSVGEPSILARRDRFPSNGIGWIKIPPAFYKLAPVLVLWGIFVGSFPPFFSIYFTTQFGMGLGNIGFLSSLSQTCQVLAVMSMPLLIGRIGRVPAIVLVQGASALILIFLIWTTPIYWAIVVYLIYLSIQVMCEPALENFAMELVSPGERNRMASLRYTTHFLMNGLAVVFTGTAITWLGYPILLGALSFIGLSSALLFYLMFQKHAKFQEEESCVMARVAPQQNS